MGQAELVQKLSGSFCRTVGVLTLAILQIQKTAVKRVCLYLILVSHCFKQLRLLNGIHSGTSVCLPLRAPEAVLIVPDD